MFDVSTMRRLLWGLGAALFLIMPEAQAQVPAVGCEHGVCFRFPGESHEPFVSHPNKLGGPFHFDNGCEGVDGPCYCNTYWGADFNHCYGGHRGTDYMLEDWFRTMRKKIDLVAPAVGEVVAAVDEYHDRCHFALRDVLFDESHDGNYCGWEVDPESGTVEERDINNNYIIIRHWNGRYYVYSRMLHIMQGSVPGWIKAELAEGRYPRVDCGERVAWVGSAGKSYAPHVHFDVRTYGPADVFGTFWIGENVPTSYDPYCGPYVHPSGRQGTYWTELPEADASFGVPHSLPGFACQDPYDPEVYDLPQRCLEAGTGR